jgi:hypothetical protein
MAEELGSFIDDRAKVPDDTVFYRRVAWDHVGGPDRCPLGESAQLTGNCFRDYKEEKAREMGYPGACMSVGAGNVLTCLGIDPMVMVSGIHQGYGLAAVTGGDLRGLVRASGAACRQGVMLWPTDKEPWHAVVFDLGGGARRPAAVCDAIGAKAYWVIPLINV